MLRYSHQHDDVPQASRRYPIIKLGLWYALPGKVERHVRDVHPRILRTGPLAFEEGQRMPVAAADVQHPAWFIHHAIYRLEGGVVPVNVGPLAGPGFVDGVVELHLGLICHTRPRLPRVSALPSPPLALPLTRHNCYR